MAAAFKRLGSSERNILIEEVNDPKFMRRHAGVAGGALSQDQQYFLGSDYKYKDPDFLAKPLVIETVLASLTDRDANVRAAALDLLRKRKDVDKEPEFRAAMEKLKGDPNPRLRLIATNVLADKTLAEALKDVEPGTVLGPLVSPVAEACGQMVACGDEEDGGKGIVVLLELEQEDGTILRGRDLSDQLWTGRVWTSVDEHALT